MNDQDKQLIEGLTNRIRNAPTPQIDPEADTLIKNGIGGRPDALYILTQTVLIQEMALNRAKSQLDELKKRTTASETPLGSGSGTAATAQAGSAAAGPSSGAPQTTAGPATPATAPPATAPQISSVSSPSAPPVPPQGGSVSGFLRTAATAAAGVIAGEAAFSAISGLFGHHAGIGSGFLGEASGVSPTSETIINNYYGDERGATGESAARDDQAADAAASDSDSDVDDSSSAEAAGESDDSYEDSAQDDDSEFQDGADDADTYDEGSDDTSHV
jgi:uncharacterized protein